MKSYKRLLAAYRDPAEKAELEAFLIARKKIMAENRKFNKLPWEVRRERLIGMGV